MSSFGGVLVCDRCTSINDVTIEQNELAYEIICKRCFKTRHASGAARDVATSTRATTGDEMNRDEIFPSKYLKAADLASKPAMVEISSATLENLKTLDGKQQSKLVVTFKGGSKAFVVNRTNYDSIAEMHGEETSAWIGKQVEIYPDITSMAGKRVACVRVRAPASADFNDSIGF